MDAFGLLGYLGIAMIREGLSDDDDEDDDKQFLGAWGNDYALCGNEP